MHVLNIHERQIPIGSEDAGILIDSLASDDDRLWPGTIWPPMRFDRPLGIGARGGHGPVRYSVEEYMPGKMVQFRFSGPRGFNGCHRFEILAHGAGCLIRHEIDMIASGPALLTWSLVFRPLHDALLEDALAKAQASLGVPPQSRPWSPWVRFLRWAFSGGKTRRDRRSGSIPGQQAG